MFESVEMDSGRWLCSKLAEHLKYNLHDLEDTASYILTIETAKDVEEYLIELLGESSSTRALVRDFLVKWKPPTKNLHSMHMASPSLSAEMYVKPKLKDVTYMQGKTPKRTEIQERPDLSLNSRAINESKIVSTKQVWASPQNQSVVAHSKKKRSKFVSVTSPDDVSSRAVRLPGRHICDCQAQQHSLVNNCTSCGKVVCEQEGAGPCTFCGTLVCSPADQELIKTNSKKGKQLLEKLMKMDLCTGMTSKGKTTRTGLPVDDKGFDKAVQHRDKLLDFDRTSERRTHVIDDEMDYFATDTNQWLSREEREKLKKRENELRELRHGSRRNKVVTLDFAGRRVINEQDEAVYSMYDAKQAELAQTKKHTSTSSGRAKQEVQESSLTGNGLVNPTISMPRPTLPSEGKKSTRAPVNGVNRKDAVRINLRVQDKELQEMRDDGLCLSMHQPWASLLVSGIKRHEGRSWYSAHRGRLWIAATAKVPSPEDIDMVENEYRTYYQDENVQFPDLYPSSCLLGCVNVVECLSEEEYHKKFPRGESSSPYVFVCENSKQLVVQFPVKGQHKIWRLGKRVHEAARLGLRRK